MATYIQGITEYIPQVQPFQPDYNFLGNVLQTKQSQYDQNYKQLSQTYGTLLNSDMLRDDNIEKRNNFFKMIDGDIKRISGMDLSLQQNADSANKVFDSFFQNKDMVKDMTFTKEYQKQMQIGESMRNCTDQEKCGGKYWDPGMQALHYKAEEFKKADKATSMMMSPGRFVPQINMQEKTTKYLETLLGTGDKNGGFGVQSVTFSKDGKYQITTTNGAALSVPFQQLIQAQYGKDQDVIDMYNTQAYVNRKGFVSGNLDKFGGDENAAEDAYFTQLDEYYKAAESGLTAAQEHSNAVRSKIDILTNQIKAKGSTGRDDLVKDYKAALADKVASDAILQDATQANILAKSVFEAGEDRVSRRNRADQLYGRSLMTKDLSESAIRAVANTGGISIKEDPYYMKQYEFSLDMAKQTSQYNLADRNNRRSAGYGLAADLAKIAATTQAAELKARGSVAGTSNKGTFVEGIAGTTAIAETDEQASITKQIISEGADAAKLANNYTSGYGNTLLGIIQDSKSNEAQINAAKNALTGIFGKAEYNQDGSLKRSGYDDKKGVFVDKRGATHATVEGIAGEYDWKGSYERAKQYGKIYRSFETHKAFLEGEGAKLDKEYNTQLELLKTTSDVWAKNNKNVKNWGLTKVAAEDRDAWNNLFTSDNKIKGLSEYSQDYNGEDAEAKYKKAYALYTKSYNEGNTMGKDNNGQPVPLVISTTGSVSFNKMGGGKSAGGGVQYEFNSDSPASLGTRGFLSMYQDALGTNAIITVGNHGDIKSALEAKANSGEMAKMALDQLWQDFRTGNLTKAEKENIVGQITYMDIALGNENIVGATIKIPTSYLQRYQKSDKNVLWADNMKLASEGVSMYVPKATAKNDFTAAYTNADKPYNYILEHNPVVIDVPNAGKVTINPRNTDGSLTVIGDVGGYDANNKWHSIPATKTYRNDPGGQNLYNAINVYLNEIAKANKAHQDKNQTYITDPNKLIGIEEQLEEAAGGMPRQQQVNPMDIFNQTVAETLFNGR